MKKILFSLLAAAAITACTKSGIEYDQPDEIGFVPVAKLNTKAAVNSTDYPDGLNMYVFAKAGLDGNNSNTVEASECTEDYFNNAEFSHKTGDKGDASNVFSGVTPYYWPNVKKLIFSGYSKSGNVADLTKKPTYDGNKITIEGYMPGAGTDVEGDNDLMWFPTVGPYAKPGNIGTDNDKDVNVVMQHACAWITINIKGDKVTGAEDTSWKIEDLTFATLSQSGNVTLDTKAIWTPGEATPFDAYTKIGPTPLTEDYVDFTILTYTDLIIIPQPTKTLTVKYSFVSQKGGSAAEDKDIVITEVKDIPLTYTSDDGWKPGVHYTYNITIGTEEILVEPTVTGWDTTTSVPEVTL